MKKAEAGPISFSFREKVHSLDENSHVFFFQMYIVLSQCCLRRVTLLKWFDKKLDQNAP